MNLILLIVIISVVISLYVMFPIFSKYLFDTGIDSDIPEDNPEYDRLVREKDQVLNEIKDIELDYGLAKLDEGDYKELRNKYRAMAAELIKKIDKYNEQPNFDINSENTMKIEKEIQNERRKILN